MSKIGFHSVRDLVVLLWPKSQNVIARTLIFAGIVLVVESNMSLLLAILLLVVENFGGNIEKTREIITEISGNPYHGFTLILFGLLYHLTFQYLDGKKERTSGAPLIELDICAPDGLVHSKKKIPMRGVLTEIPILKDIPLYQPTAFNLNGKIYSLPFTSDGRQPNSDFYKDRAKFLKTWGGAEVLTLRLVNDSPYLAHNVSLELTIPRIEGVSSDNIESSLPKLPSETNNHHFLGGFPPRNFEYDIKSSHTADHFIYTWAVGDIQANTQVEANTYLYIRAESDLNLEIAIYCDEFSKPNSFNAVLISTKKRRVITLDEIMSDDSEFINILDDCVMEGHISIAIEEEIQQMKKEDSEFRP